MTPNSVVFHWTPASGTPAPIYQTQVQQPGDLSWQGNPAGTTSGLQQTHAGLAPATTYNGRVQASNVAGPNWSDTVEFTTPPALTVSRDFVCATEWRTPPAPSADGTDVTTVGPTVVDAGGNVWALQTFGGSTYVVRNGVQNTTTSGAVELLYYGKSIYYKGTAWFIWNGSAFTASTDPRVPISTESADGTVLNSTTGTITDTTGVVWKLANSAYDVSRNGAIDTTVDATQALLYRAHLVYRESTGGLWYKWGGSSWTSVEADPRIPIVHAGDGTTFTDGNGVTWGISNAQVTRNGVIDTTTNSVVEIALVSGKVWHKNTSGYWYYNDTTNSPPWSPTGGQIQSPLITPGGPVSTTRNYWDQPGGALSAYNRPIGDGAVAGLVGDPDTPYIWMGWDGSALTTGPVAYINTVDNYGCTDWTGSASDGQYTFSSSNNGRGGAKSGIDAGGTLTAKLHVPTGAITPGPYPADNSLVLQDPVNYPGRQYYFGGLSIQPPGLQPGQGPFTANAAEWDDATSDQYGHDADTGLAGYNVGAGVITGWDVNPTRPGYPDIQHALRYSTDAHLLQVNDNGDGYTLKADSWPQHYQDGQSGINVYSGKLKAGTTLYIPQGATMPSGMTAEGQAMFRTMQRHPCFFRDQAGGGFHLTCTQDADSTTYMAHLRQDLPKLVALLRPMRNQHQTGQAMDNVNGPGNRLYPGPPPLAAIGGTVPTPTSAPTLSESADNTQVAAGTTGKIIDANKATWTISGGVVYKDAATAGYSANVVLLAYENHTVWQENDSNSWYSWTGSDWGGPYADPRPGTPTVTPTPTAAPSTVKYMGLGDSLIVGVTTIAGTASLAPGGFRATLYNKMVADNYKVQFVGDQTTNQGTLPDSQANHEGIGGIKIEDLQAQLISSGILGTTNPDVIDVMVGTNNVSVGIANTTVDPAIATKMAAFLDYLIGATSAKIRLSNLLRRADDGNNQIGQFNSQLPGIISANGRASRVTLIDNYSVIALSDLASPDPIHPLIGAYPKLADPFYTDFKTLFTPPPTVTPTPTSTGTGNYETVSGRVVTPTGQPWYGVGPNCYSGSTTAAQMRASFPGMSFLRGPTPTFQNPSDWDPIVNVLTPLGIPVMIYYHPYPFLSSDNIPSGYQDWITAVSTHFKGNRMVWPGSMNEPQGGNITQEHLNVYNWVRATGNDSMIVFSAGVGGGNPRNTGVAVLNKANYAGMKRVMFDLHAYGWIVHDYLGTDDTTNQNNVNTSLVGDNSGTGVRSLTVINSQDGAMAVGNFEFGPSTDGTHDDANGNQLIFGVTDYLMRNKLNNGFAGWNWWIGDGFSDQLTDNHNNLTTWGTQLKTAIANANAWLAPQLTPTTTPTPTSAPTGLPRVPAPLTGTVTKGSWVAKDITVSGVSLPSGKAIHFEYLLPANYRPDLYVYPIHIWAHPTFEGNPWYNGNNNNPNFLSALDADRWYNTVDFRTRYPGIVVVLYADQTSNNDAIDNFGGWFNNGSTGSGTHASGDTGPNVFATIGIVKWVIANLSGDPYRVYPFGFSLGAIGTEYWMLKYNQVNGSQKIFTAGFAVAGVVEQGGPQTADYTAMQNVPVIYVSGAGDTNSKPADWNDLLWQKFAGNTNYPAPGTDLNAGAKAGSSQFRYWRNPNTGHQQDDGQGHDYPVNDQILKFIYAQVGSASGAVTAVTPTPTPTTTPLSLAAGTVYWGVAGHRDRTTGVYGTVSLAKQITDIQAIFGTGRGTTIYRCLGDTMTTGFAADVATIQAAGIIPIVSLLTKPGWGSFTSEASAYTTAYASVSSSVGSAPGNIVWEIGQEWVLQDIFSQITGSDGGLSPADYTGAAVYPKYRAFMGGAIAAVRDKGVAGSQVICSVLSGGTYQGLALALAADLQSYQGRNLMWDFTAEHWYNDVLGGPSTPGQPDNFSSGKSVFTILKPAAKPILFTEFGSSTVALPANVAAAAANTTALMDTIYAHRAGTNTEPGCIGGAVYELYQELQPGVGVDPKQCNFGLYTVSGSVTTMTPQGTAVKNWLAAHGAAGGASASGTRITPGSGQLTDSAGNVYTITSNGSATMNGSGMNNGGGTGAMEYYNGAVYGQDATSGTWYLWNGSDFVATGVVPP